jgi:integrase
VTICRAGQQREEIVRGTRRQATAREAELRLREPSTTSLRAGMTLRQLCAGPYADHAETHLERSTWRTRSYQLAAVCARLGEVQLDTLSAAHVERYQADRLRDRPKRGLPGVERMGRGTVNAEVRSLVTVLRWAQSVGLRCSVPRVRRLRESTPRVRAFSTEELQQLWRSVRAECPHLLPMLVVMVNTGIREGEAIRAEWSWVDTARSLICIPVLPDWRPKNGKPREVPFGDAARAAMGSRTSGPLFPRLDGAPYGTFPKDLWWRAARAVGLQGGAHQLRHTFASHFLAAVPDLQVLADVMGHSSTRTTLLYAHLLPSHRERARGAVDLAPTLSVLAGGLAAIPK